MNGHGEESQAGSLPAHGEESTLADDEELMSERLIQVVQTAGGYGRYDYGSKPREYRISLTTGLAGVYGPGGVQDLRQFEPQPGKPDALWPFEFPGEFRGKRWVKVTQFR